MDRFKLKNFILIMLALVNLFLLIIVVSNERETKRLRLEREESLRAIFLSNEIDLAEDIDLGTEALQELSLVRNLSAEEDAVSSLIGKCDTQDLGGSIIYYSSQNGAARFRGTAEFELILEPGIVMSGSSPVVTAADAVRRLGFKSLPDRAEVRQNGNDSTISLGLEYKRRPVFNCRISCYFSNGSMSIAEGRAFFGQIKSRGATEGMPDACTILMRFLEHMRAEELSCGSISALEPGYFAESAVVGECVLRPVWRVETDLGDFFLDGVTGAMVQLDTREDT